MAFRGQLGAVVADDSVRTSHAPANDVVEFPRDAPAGDRGVGNERQAFSGAVVDHRQDAETPSVGQLVADKGSNAGWLPAASRSAAWFPSPACAHPAGARSAAPRGRGAE